MKNILEMTVAECQRMTIGEILSALAEEVKSNSNDTKRIETVRIIKQLIEDNQIDFETTVSYTLREIGIPANVKGDRYLTNAIIQVIKNPGLISSMTTVLYPSIAKEYNTTWERVERNIRNAIEIAWNRGNEDYFSAYFGYSKKDGRKKTTSSEFIATIADKLRIRFKMEGKL